MPYIFHFWYWTVVNSKLYVSAALPLRKEPLYLVDKRLDWRASHSLGTVMNREEKESNPCFLDIELLVIMMT